MAYRIRVVLAALVTSASLGIAAGVTAPAASASPVPAPQPHQPADTHGAFVSHLAILLIIRSDIRGIGFIVADCAHIKPKPESCVVPQP